MFAESKITSEKFRGYSSFKIKRTVSYFLKIYLNPTPNLAAVKYVP